LLGGDVYREISRDSGYPDWNERMFGQLTEFQTEKVSEMQERFQTAQSELYAKAGGYMDADMQGELKTLRRQFREELKTVLTPEQVEEYELRSSDVANTMRWELESFQPNEQEFRAIFAYKQGIEDGGTIEAGGRTWHESNPKLKQMEEVLGPERMKEFKLMENWEFRNLFQSQFPRESILEIAPITNT